MKVEELEVHVLGTYCGVVNPANDLGRRRPEETGPQHRPDLLLLRPLIS